MKNERNILFPEISKMTDVELSMEVRSIREIIKATANELIGQLGWDSSYVYVGMGGAIRNARAFPLLKHAESIHHNLDYYQCLVDEIYYRNI